jgi:hypothetical protein
MKIYKESEKSELFQLHQVTIEQLIALNDIAKNYRSYIEGLLKMSDKELLAVAPNSDAKLARQSIKLQKTTCLSYEQAFSEIIEQSKKPLQN